MVDPWTMVTVGLVEATLAAERLGIFAALAAPHTLDELANRLELDPRALALLLDPLRAAGYVSRDAEARFRVAPTTLSAGAGWSRLLTFLEEGSVSPHIDDPVRRRYFYRETTEALGEAYLTRARRLATRLRPARRILDVGAGSAVWSLTMAEAAPATQVIAVDAPEVLPVAERFAGRLGLDAHLTLVACDYFAPPSFDRPFDRIVLANVLHLEPTHRAATLVALYADHLTPEGELVVVDILDDDDPLMATGRAVYALHLGMRTHLGAAHRRADIDSWTAEAGLRTVATVTVPPLAAIVCEPARPRRPDTPRPS